MESRAGANTRTFATAAAQYLNKWNVFPPDVASMGGTTCASTAPTASAACVIDQSWATDITAGNLVGSYKYTYAVTSGVFTMNVDPDPNASNVKRHFFTDNTLGIHYNDTAAASAADPTL